MDGCFDDDLFAENHPKVYVAVNITEEEFVRVAVGIENPDGAVVRKFGNARTQEVEVSLRNGFVFVCLDVV